MNLSKLFETQAELDKHIVEEKGLQGQDLLDKKILALQVELGELANEQRSWKFWSEDQKARTHVGIFCFYCAGHGFDERGRRCDSCKEGITGYKNPLLEEYVDCLHFILSIGNELELKITNPAFSRIVTYQTEKQFNLLFYNISKLSPLNNWSSRADEKMIYSSVFNDFLGLGKMLGFTWDQIEDAYFEKNKINHERQVNGY